jgi:DNA-binding transcriptional regulator YhcF (GntR family)
MAQFAKVPHRLLELKIKQNGKEAPENDAVKYTLIALLYYRSQNSNTIKVKLSTIAKVTKLSTRQITRNIKQLIAHKMISRKQKLHGNNEFGCNIYKLLYQEEDDYTELPFEIIENKNIPITAKIGYCVIKRAANKEIGKWYGKRAELAKKLQCSINHVDKIRRYLKQANLIEYTASEITLKPIISNDVKKKKIKKSVHKIIDAGVEVYEDDTNTSS